MKRSGNETVPRPRYPSIFNDVIGPVMRGPSSSHCAASVRIGRVARDLMDGKLSQVLIEFDPHGSLATTHESQGSDMGLFGGLMGWDATDDRLVGSAQAIHDAGIGTQIEIVEYEASHPNTYRLTLTGPQETHQMVAISTGGGMIEIVEVDGARVSMEGDVYETLIYVDGDGEALAQHLSATIIADDVLLRAGEPHRFVEVKGQRFLNEDTISTLRTRYAIQAIKRISPVLPILSRRELEVPFVTCDEMLAYNEGRALDLGQLALRYESARGNMSQDKVLARMLDIVQIMEASIQQGIAGTEYQDRILRVQSGAFKAQMDRNQLLDAGMLNRIILYVTAMMEIKSAMGVIVAAPTAGACAGLPGACIGAAAHMGLPSEDVAKAMLAAGMIGVLIAARSTFAAEVCGCQAECGAGSGMAAAGLVTLAGGTARQAVDAASMALQNILGMICDPVANRVEVPCLGKNVMAASNALACANMALAGFDAVIPLDEVIETMDAVGKSLPPELRCTALGGLSITKASREIETRLVAGDRPSPS